MATAKRRAHSKRTQAAAPEKDQQPTSIDSGAANAPSSNLLVFDVEMNWTKNTITYTIKEIPCVHVDGVQTRIRQFKAARLMELVLRAISYGVVRLVRSEHVPTLLELAFDGIRMIVGDERGELSLSKLAECVSGGHFGWAKIEAAIAKATGKDGGQL